ncbi:hypothetical protein ACYU03_03815 [Pseudomonas sp. X10]
MAQSSELTGGAGFDFEGHIAAYFLSSLLTSDVRPPFNLRAKSVAMQQSAFGAPLDDIIITFEDSYQSTLHLQVKRALIISAAKTNTDFREVVINSWSTFKDPKNTHLHNNYGAATGSISSKGLRNLRTVCLAARNSHNEKIFFSRNNKSGTASKSFDDFIKIIRTILSDNKILFSDSELHNFLKNFVILHFDILTPESITNTETINRLAQVLTAPHRASGLLESLKNIAREGASVAASFDRESLKRKLYPLFAFTSDIADLKTLVKTPHLNQEQQHKCIADATICDAILSSLNLESGLIHVTVIIVTDNPQALAHEIKRWKNKLKRSSLLLSDDNSSFDDMSLTDLFKKFHFANILLQELATAELSIYIYYARNTDGVNEWGAEKLEKEIIMTPILHRLSHKHETIKTVYSEIPEIERITNTASHEVLERYRRQIQPKIASTYAKNKQELVQLSDLIANIAASFLTSGSTYPPEYIAYIRTRIRYGENIATGEKHLRDRNPIA